MGEKLILDGSKVLYHRDRIDAYLRGERIAPITIDCALTTKCTYRCVYCYGKMQLINQFPSIERDIVMGFLDDAAEIGVKAVSFVSDGESTCNPCYADAIVHGKNKGLDMALGTNGFLLTKESLEQILPCLTYLRFNISAGEKDRYMEIHGVNSEVYERTIGNIKTAVEIKNRKGLPVTIGLQMVLMPEFEDQIIPLTKLGKELGVDYLVIKHCSDDEEHTLGVDYGAYDRMIETMKEAETYSTKHYQVSVKWSKIQSHGHKCYKLCYGAPFIIQMSGSGLVAPCGMFFNDKYKEYHIGNIKEKRFKEIWESDRYWEVMKKIATPPFDTNRDCGTLCLQHKTNEEIWRIVEENAGKIPEVDMSKLPQHINFI
ncbi:radical SAM/SPASM domain-containing protein [Butyrivibrio sp. VCD2006]|uniref:radical SAM/SPASM domain-containing protein n=1 Tax=Butyrivibrio sp. VCD2006 TaxID=1280664 RepID=UPI00047B0225|nr:radical SAM protein [Butyrivibrio sp. VCD2006]